MPRKWPEGGDAPVPVLIQPKQDNTHGDDESKKQETLDYNKESSSIAVESRVRDESSGL